MAIVFTDGFDHLKAADILQKWTGYSNGGSASDLQGISPSFARPPGGMGMQYGSGNAGRGIYRTLSSTHTTFVCGFHIYFPVSTPTSTGAPFLIFWDSSSAIGSTYQLCLRADAGSHLVVATGSNAATVLTTSTNVFSAATWYHIEIKATINNTTGSYEVKVNGSSTGWITAQTGKNTRGQSSNNFIDTVGLCSALLGTSNAPYFDDFYFLSSSSPNNDFLGPQKILTLFPSGAGNYAQWTGNYAANHINVSEVGADGDSTFNQSATANQIDTFTFDDVPAGTVAGIVHNFQVRQDAGAARTFAAVQRSSSTDYVGTTLNCAGSYQILQDPKDTDPATSSAYTASNLSSAEFGYKLIS